MGTAQKISSAVSVILRSGDRRPFTVMKHACVLVVVVALALAPAASADAWSTPKRVAGSSDGPVYDMWFGRSGGGLLGALCCNGFGRGVPGTTLSSSDG